MSLLASAARIAETVAQPQQTVLCTRWSHLLAGYRSAEAALPLLLIFSEQNISHPVIFPSTPSPPSKNFRRFAAIFGLFRQF